MATDPVISVRGEAVLEVEPEIARIGVTVMARDKDRHRAVARLAERTRAIAAMITDYGDAIEKLESHAIGVRPEFKVAKARENVAGYVASSGFALTVVDFGVLGELVPRLAAAELVSVTGPDWEVRPDSPARREVRLRAARDAIARAGEYAEAFGGRLTGLVEAADTGLMTEQRQGRFVSTSAMAASRLVAADDAPDFDFVPARQVLSAQVDARFTMSPPEFGKREG
jgi:uncharacterized protein